MISGWILICVWVVLAFVMAVIPSNDHHWRRAYVLMALGFPALIWIFWSEGLWMGLLGLVIGGIVLRWPVYYLWRWLRARIGQGHG